VKVTEAFHTLRKLSAIAGVYGVSLSTLVTVITHSGRGALGAKFNVSDTLSGLESEGAAGIVDCKGEA
jgi:hypothetical protein